ncbi:MAG TPA: tetratricopeptide repeat protein [Pyrinomonadaceae bacterium]|nr:tetratricopeptide repeat protein [Pyrinomonadaceae bacterium]
MKTECCGFRYTRILLYILLAAVVSLSGCTDPEKAKAEHTRRGEEHLKALKYTEASLEFRNALQIDDRFGPAHWGLARSYEGLQRLPEMISELQKTIEFDKNNLDAKVKLANYYLAASKGHPELLTEAERLAKETLEKDANHIEGHILMGSILFAQNDREKAFAELNKAIGLNPQRVESYLSLARFYIVSRETVKAEETFKKAISIDGNSPLAYSEYGKFLVQQNRLGEAEAALNKAVEVKPDDRNARFVLASFYLINKQLDKAEAAFKALAGLDSDKPESQVVLADFYSSVGRMDEAVKIYQDVLAKSPDYVQGRYRLAEILLVRGDSQGALSQIDEALKKDKHDRQALLLRARMRAQGGQTEGLKAAIEDLKDVLNQEPNSRLGLYYMAQAQFGLGLADQARAFAGELDKNYPDYLPGKLMQLQLTLFGGDTNAAKSAITLATDLLNRLSKTAPDRENSPQVLGEIQEKTLLARGTAQMQLKNLAAARQDFELAKQIAPKDPNVYNSLAFLALQENKQEEALAAFDQATQVDATNFAALNGLLTLYARDNQLDKGQARVDQLLASNPNSAMLHYFKAQIFRLQKDMSSAEAEFRKSLDLDPNYIASYSALGEMFIGAKQEDRAIAEYQKILAIKPDNASVYTLIGMLEDSRKNFDAAEQNYRKALEKDPNSVFAANNLAWLYAMTGRGNLDEALRLAQGVVQKNPNVAGFIDTLGWVYYKKNLYDLAIDQLQKAVALDEAVARTAKGTPSATYQFHLGMALKEKGDKDGSRRALEASLRLGEQKPFPYADEAKHALSSL